VPGFEDCGQGYDSGDCAQSLRSAGGGDDGGRKPAAPGFELHGAGVGVLQVEPGLQADARADWAASRDFAGVGFELHAVVAAAAFGCAVFAGREIGIQRGASAFDANRSEPDSEDCG